jgi:signal transduction histidine kinase/CheY-like chemotaxis protein
METLKKAGKIKNLEIQSLTKSGRLKNVLLTASLKGGVISGVVKDISATKQFDRELMHAQKLESLGRLAGGIAHDFNNILGIIIGHSAILDRLKSDPIKFSQSVDAISKAAVRGASLVKQLLTFAGQTDAVFEPVRINDVVTEIRKLVEETFPKTITISTALQPNQPYIMGDATQIHQVLLNLCINARDAMPKGGALSISTRAVDGKTVRASSPTATARHYVQIEVADTGIGMSATIRQRVFEPFFTTKGPGKGTGLGLALVTSIVESHNGIVGVESKLGTGTTFTVYLPALEHAAEATHQARQAIQDVPGGSETILLIEDEERLRELLRAMLVAKGYSVITAGDGKQGLEEFLAHQGEIAVVVSDLGLPMLGGVEVFERIRAKDPRAKVIVASGIIDEETKSEVRRVGATHFIQKPYLPDEVLRKIREVIDTDE